MEALEAVVSVALIGGFGFFLYTRYAAAKKRREENAKNPGSGGGRNPGSGGGGKVQEP